MVCVARALDCFYTQGSKEHFVHGWRVHCYIHPTRRASYVTENTPKMLVCTHGNGNNTAVVEGATTSRSRRHAVSRMRSSSLSLSYIVLLQY